MMTVMIVLAIAALAAAVVSATGHAPLWVSVILICIIELIRVLPLGK